MPADGAGKARGDGFGAGAFGLAGRAQCQGVLDPVGNLALPAIVAGGRSRGKNVGQHRCEMLRQNVGLRQAGGGGAGDRGGDLGIGEGGLQVLQIGGEGSPGIEVGFQH